MIKIGTIIAIPLALYAGVSLAFSIGNSDVKGIFIAIGLYIAAAWLHGVAIKDYNNSKALWDGKESKI